MIIAYKKLLFEYLVFQLVNWANEIDSINVPTLSKLRLQKILFLVCAKNATINNPALLNTFNRFYALPYGPVEMDIYESMKGISPFEHIHFNDTNCICDIITEEIFSSLDELDRKYIDDTLDSFKQSGAKYLTMPIFELVNISHQWTAWQVAMSIAKLLSSNKEVMTTEDICLSSIKAF